MFGTITIHDDLEANPQNSLSKNQKEINKQFKATLL